MEIVARKKKKKRKEKRTKHDIFTDNRISGELPIYFSSILSPLSPKARTLCVSGKHRTRNCTINLTKRRATRPLPVISSRVIKAPLIFLLIVSREKIYRPGNCPGIGNAIDQYSKLHCFNVRDHVFVLRNEMTLMIYIATNFHFPFRSALS